jgi:site-specific recombinase XerD
MPEGPKLPLLRSFLTSLGEQGLAEETIRLVGADIRALEGYITEKTGGVLTEEQALSEELIRGFIKEGKNKALVVRRLGTLRKWLNYAVENKVIGSNFLPLGEVTYQSFLGEEGDVKEKQLSCLSENEAKAIVRYLERRASENGVDREVYDSLYILMGLMLSGVSPSKAEEVGRQDIKKTKAGRIEIRYQDRFIPLSSRVDPGLYWKTTRRLIRKIGQRKEDGFSVFVNRRSFYYHLKKELKKAGVKRGVNVAEFHRRAIIDLKKQGRSIKEIANLLSLSDYGVWEIVTCTDRP